MPLMASSQPSKKAFREISAGPSSSVGLRWASRIKTVPQVVVPVVRKTFYKDSAPESLKSEWKALKHELATDASFKESGVLYYTLPDKCVMTFKAGETTLRSIDSRFESAGSLFYKSGDKLTIELKKNSWDKPFVISWTPVAGNADVLCPDNSILNPKTEK